MKIVNLTPHRINLCENETEIASFEPSGIVPRVKTESARFDKVAVGSFEFDIVKAVYGDIIDLPEPQDGVMFIVSTLILLALKEKGQERDDLIAPDTSPDSVVRDGEERIIGVKRFQII